MDLFSRARMALLAGVAQAIPLTMLGRLGGSQLSPVLPGIFYPSPFRTDAIVSTSAYIVGLASFMPELVSFFLRRPKLLAVAVFAV